MLANRMRILVVEPVGALSQLYCAHLQKAGHITSSAPDADLAVECIENSMNDAIDLLIIDSKIAAATLMDVINKARVINQAVETIVITATTDLEIAMKAVRRGAFDYLIKPVSAERLLTTVRNAVDHAELKLTLRRYKEESELSGYNGLVGKSLPMQAVYRAIRHVSTTDYPVFISAAMGAGKKITANAIHEASTRSGKSFVAIDCDADNIQALLFGGMASKSKASDDIAPPEILAALRQADGGTLYLNKIEKLPLNAQKDLLEFVMTGALPPQKGMASRNAADVRIICACVDDVRTAISQGKFNEELFCALNVHSIGLPSLNERDDDIQLLAKCFLSEWNKRLGKRVHDFSPEAMDAMVKHNWVGNVSELKAFIGGICRKYDSGIISLNLLPAFSVSSVVHTNSEDKISVQCRGMEYDGVSAESSSLDDIERWVIETRIKAMSGSIPKAAQSLGISPSTIYRKREGWIGQYHKKSDAELAALL